MTAAVYADQSAAQLLRRAATLRLLSLTLECPRPGWREELISLADEIGQPELRHLAEQAGSQASPEGYHTLFGPGGPVASREISYIATVLPGTVIAELQASYDAFAYRPSVDEPADHIAVEIGFLSYLHLKMAYALSTGNRQQAEIVAQAVKRFSAAHLADMLCPFCANLEASQVGYLVAVAAVLKRILPIDIRTAG